MIRRWWLRRRCMHGLAAPGLSSPPGTSWVRAHGMADHFRKVYECSNCGRIWVS